MLFLFFSGAAQNRVWYVIIMNTINNNLEINLPEENLDVTVSRDGYWFGQETIELVNMLSNGKWHNAIDIGCGDGIIALLLGRRQLVKKDIWAVDIDSNHCLQSQDNIQRNHLAGQIRVLNRNIRSLKSVFQKGTFDLVTANPPFFPPHQDHQNLASDEVNARQEKTGDLRFFLQAADYLISNRGDLYLLYHPSRLDTMFFELNKTKIRCKEIQILHHQDGRALFVLCHGVKNAKPGMKILPPKTLGRSLKLDLENT